MNPKTHPQNNNPGKNTATAISKMTASPRLQMVLLVFFTSLLYANILFNGFVYDDYAIIVENKHIQEPLKNLPALFNRGYFDIAAGEASYRPIATLSYYLIYAVAGLNPFLYHLFSMIIHVANVILVYLLIGCMAKNKWITLMAAALFACHPALTEAVAVISYNEDLLTAFFFLLAFWFYLKLGSDGFKSNTKYYGLSLICFLLGLLSKEMAITLPVILVLYDVSLRNETGKPSFSLQKVIKTFKDRGLFYGGFLAVSLLYLLIRFFILYDPQKSIKSYSGNWLERIIFLPDHIFSFIKLAVVPVHLTADYVFSYPLRFFSASNLSGFMVVTGLVGGSVFIFKYSKKIFFAVWWFIITLFPVYNIIPIFNPFAERYLYIPLVGFCMLVAIVIHTSFHQRFSASVWTNIVKVLVIFLLLNFYASVTIQRNRDWKDSLTLWSETVITSPDSSIAHGSLGRAYQDQGRIEEAIAEYNKAIELYPRNYKAFYNLGVLYESQGAIAEATDYYEKAIAVNPAFVDARFNLANIYHNQGLLNEAIEHYRKVTELDPTDFEARNNLGVTYARQGDLTSAVEEWKNV
ncbi:MAG: tetratricopeptide repeat protein, partial [Desulfobacterales bacterium]